MIEIVAEAGLNHNGSLDLAKKLADEALLCGANIVKYQTYNPDKLLRLNDPDFELLASLALKHEEFKELTKFCEGIGIEFMTTPGDLDSLKFAVEELGVKRIKIGSDDLTNHKLLFAARETMLPIILSTGMANLSEIYDAMCVTTKHNLTLLHCVSCYPCRLKDANLRAITTMREAFKEYEIPIGYSDHTGDKNVVLAAAALGATIIEAHFMLLDDKPPVDEAVSYTPKQFKWMVHSIREIEVALGHGRKEPCAEELKVINKLRKGEDGLRGVA